MALSRFVDEIESASGRPETLALPSQETASCEEAWRYETTASSRNCVCCARRSGKTTAGGRRAVRVLLTVPDARVHISSLVKDNVRETFWIPIKELLNTLGVRYLANETTLRLEIPANGSVLKCWGVDDMEGVKKPQGRRATLWIIDECHLPNDNILNALLKAIKPMFMDHGGMLDLLGLPPEVEPSTFSDALDNPEWSTFKWNWLDHDHPRPREQKLAEVEEDIKERGLTWESPEIQRDYLGRRVRDPSKSAYEYQQGRNDYDPGAVQFDSGWLHAVGLDLGFQDRDAIVVLAWRMDDPSRRVLARFIWQRNHLSTDSLSSVVGLVAQAYRPIAWTGDTGGHGAVKVLATLMERLRISIAPKPPDVLVSLGYVNDDLRTGRLLLPTYDVETDRLAEMARRKYAQRPTELAEVLGLLADSWSAPGPELAKVARVVKPGTLKMTINPKGPNHSDVSEALRYAHAGAQNWLATQPEAKRKPTLLEREEEEELQERLDSARDVGRSWYQRQAGRSSGAAHRLLSR